MNNTQTQSSVISNINARVAEVYKYLALSVLMAAFGSFMGIQNLSLMSGGMFWAFVIAEFAFLITLFFVKEKPGINLFVLFGFTFLSGFTLAPLLATSLAINPDILMNALLTTSVAVGAISLYAINTKRDFSGIGKYLFIALVILIVASLANIFFQSSLFHLGLTIISAILFSFYLIYDTQNIVNNNFDHPMTAAVGVYIDILNIFVSILQLFMSFTGNDD